MKIHDKTGCKKILDILYKHFPDSKKVWLKRANPYETLICTMFSAHTTDASVDKIAPIFFSKYPDVKKLAKANASDVEKIIRSVGLYKNKAKNAIAAAKMICEYFKGKVPETREELVKLAGVGRKTANVVMIKCFGLNAMPVDTHIFRVANRLGIASAKTPEKTELQLCEQIEEERLAQAHFLLIEHGRNICVARNPKCEICPISHLCFYYSKTKGAK